MSEFKFPQPKTDTPEIAFFRPLRAEASGQSLSVTRIADADTTERIPLLPGQPFSLLSTKTNAVAKDLPYTVELVIKNKLEVFAAEQGVLYSSNAFTKGTHRGLVLLCHGKLGQLDLNLMYQTVFDDLARCLAKNGFIVVSIRHGEGNTNNGDSFVRHTRFLLESTAINNRFALEGKPVAFVGHSESGPAAIKAAKRVANFEISNVIGWIHAVVGFAPTEATESDYAGSLLVLQGSHDGDTPAGGASILPYDNSAAMVTKHFCWVHGGNHAGFFFTTPQNDGIEFPTTFAISLYTQRAIANNYVTAFLRWRMNNESSFRPLFVGDGTFSFAQDPNVQLQNDIKGNKLHVLPLYDAFEHKKLGHETTYKFIGMSQKGSLITAQNPPKFSEIRVLDPTAKPQRTIGIIVQWDTKKHPIAAVSVPCPSWVMKANPKFVEFQAAMVGSSYLTTGVQIPIVLSRLVNNKVVQTPPVVVTIPTPVVIPTSSIGTPFTRCMLSTIRVPLIAWGVFPASSVVELFLNFSGASIKSGAIAIAGFRASLV